jgi:Zn-dependent protease with chaperone function
MRYCAKCGKAVADDSAAYCSACGAPLGPAAGPPKTQSLPHIITVESLRSRGESVALVAGFSLLALSWLVLDVSTEFLPGLLATGGLILYVFYQQGALKGSSVAVCPQNFPDVETLANEAALRLGIGQPPLFIKHSREINAYAIGFVGASCVVLHSETVQATQNAPRELQFIIGHEFTHIKCSHVLWQTIAGKNPIFGRVPVLNLALPFFFSWWSRQAEFTADRGGLIACGDLMASQKALARLVIGAELFDRLNVEEFIKQADGDVATKASELLSSHPLLAKRMKALAEFSQSPLFAETRSTDARSTRA